MLSDTHPDAEAVQFELLRRMTPSRKLEMVFKLTAAVVAFSRQGIHDRNPGLTVREVDLMFIALVWKYQRETEDANYIAEWAATLNVLDLWERIRG